MKKKKIRNLQNLHLKIFTDITVQDVVWLLLESQSLEEAETTLTQLIYNFELLEHFHFIHLHTQARMHTHVSWSDEACFLPWVYNSAVTPGHIRGSFISGR